MPELRELPAVVVLTALMAEAVPMINHFKMTKQARSGPYHLYQSASLDLLVTGIGYQRMAGAIRHYIQTRKVTEQTRWLNIGIAGTLNKPVGSLVWANEIGEQEIAVPQQAEKHPLMRVYSLSEPSTAYRAGVLFDMEAQACLDTLSENIIEFEPAHLFCAKVVSDNQLEPTLNKDKHRVMALLQKHQQPLSDFIKILL